MKKLLFLFAIVSGLNARAQLIIPAEVTQRLQNDKSFTSFAREMMRYVRTRQSDFAADSVRKKFFEKQEKYLARELWYLEGRQEANGDIANYTRKIYDEYNSYKAARAEDPSNLTAYGIWNVVGPTNMTTSTTSLHTGIGRVNCITFHPSDANTIYAGTPAGGIFRTTNGGTSWSPISSYIPSLGISGMVVSWANANTLYALTGDGDSNIGDGGFVQGYDYIRPSVGVLKSTDAGANWQETGDFGLTGFYVGYKLVQSPTNSNVLIAATSNGLFRTINGGISWSLVSPNSSRYYDIEWKPGSSTVVYAATAGTFYISTDGGASFTNSNSNFDVAIGSCTRIAIAVTPINASYVYVFASDGAGANKGVYRSTNSGAAFTQRTTDGTIASSSPGYMHNIAVASDNVNIVLTGGLEIYRSTNGASSFTLSNQRGDATLSNYAHDDVHEIAYNPLNNAVYIGCDGGVYKSTDDGVSYTALYSGLASSQYFHFDVSAFNDDYMFGGAQDNGGHYRPGATATFRNTIKGDGYFARFYNGSATQVYLSINKSLYQSNSTLTAWTQMLGLDDDWYKTIAISPSSNNIVFASSNPVYKTTNGGTSWSSVGANGRWAMITCPSNSNRVYAAGGDSWNDGGNQSGKKMYRSDDQGANWVEIQDNPGFPATITKITGIGVDPGNSLRIWATMGGFTAGQKVYYSNNGGDTWQNISGSIPNIPVNCVTIDANLDAYIGTDIGVFFKSSTTTDWQPFYNYLPRVPVTELHISNGYIYASTFGRGIWKSEAHGDCPASLLLSGNITGVRFYEATGIASTTNIVGGIGTEILLRAADHVTLNPGFTADASSGEKFRAWIAPCNSGGIYTFLIPELNKWSSSGKNNDALIINKEKERATFNFEMPFDGTACLLAVNEKDELKEVFLNNKMLMKGKQVIKFDQIPELEKRKIVLLIDGQVVSVKN